MEKMLLRSLLYQHSQQPQPTWGTPEDCGQASTQPQTAQDNRTQLGPFLPLQVWNVISLELHLGIAPEHLVPCPSVLPVRAGISQLPTSPPVSFSVHEMEPILATRVARAQSDPTSISPLVSPTSSASTVPQNPGPGAPLKLAD